MSKKNKKHLPSKSDIRSPISKRGWKLIGGGLSAVILGFVLVLCTDPQGQNWASRLCPFLLIGGYATIGFGIIAKDIPASDPSIQ